MDIVNAIAQDDVMNLVTIIRKGTAAKSFDANNIFATAQAKINKANAEKAKKAAEEIREINGRRYYN